MSIFSKVFLAIATFIANLWASTKTEWNKLSPEIQSDFTRVITALNLVKAYVLNPSTAPGAISFLLTAIESAIGPIYMAVINAALNEALIDAGIIEQAFTDPVDAYTALITHLKTFAPNSVGDQIGVWVSNIVGKLVTELNNNQIKSVIAFVYDTFFKVAVVPAAASVPEIPPTIAAQPDISSAPPTIGVGASQG